MFKLLQQTVAEDFNDDATAATKSLGSAFAAGYNKTKGKIAADKEQAARDQEKSATEKEKADKAQAELDAKARGNERLQSIVHSIYAFMPVPPLAQGELLDKNGNVKDPEWHEMTAEELAFVKKYMTRVEKTFKEFRAQLEKRMTASSFLTNQERKSVSTLMATAPTEIDSHTHEIMGEKLADEITAMLKTGNIKTGIDVCMSIVKGYSDSVSKSQVMTAPLAVDRGLFILGAALNNYQDRLSSVASAVDEHEFGRVLNPDEAKAKAQEQDQADKKPVPTASMKKPEPEPEVKESRKLVGFRPLTESEA